MLGGSWKACSASLGFPAPLSLPLSAERSLLVAHLAQARSHGLKLSHLDVIDGGRLRSNLQGTDILVPPFDFLEFRQKDLGVHHLMPHHERREQRMHLVCNGLA